MALPLPPGLTPSEAVFLCEMELVTVIPRQKLDALELLGGSVPALQPPLRSDVPLWLALLLKKQRRANIVPPPWLDADSLAIVLQVETEHEKEAFSAAPPLPRAGSGMDSLSPPFVPSSTIEAQTRAMPYHWMEMGEILLEAAADDFRAADQVRRLLRDLREARLAKLRAGIEVLDGAGGVQMNGVGAMEVAEGRAFICGVIDGLRYAISLTAQADTLTDGDGSKIGASRELAKREQEMDDAGGYQQNADDDDDDML